MLLVWLLASFLAHPLSHEESDRGGAPLLPGAELPSSVADVFAHACINCHSEKTRWPWYSQIAPVSWLVENDVRYVLWLQKDNDSMNARFLPLWDKIRPRYAWRHFAGNDGDWAVGFWERIDPPAP